MNLRRTTCAVAALALSGTAFATATAPAEAGGSKLGTRSLATVLAGGNGFDANPRDFDVLDHAVKAVLVADPRSPVRVLTKGRVPLTAFAPTDAAFRLLLEDLTGKWYKSERRVFRKLVRTVGVGRIEKVLLYHVVPGETITYKQARAADGVRLRTALGKTLKVRVRGSDVILVDKDRNDANARLVYELRNINKGNRQIAHGVNRVLRPVDLP